jgi:dinuclear metal center YbgI/SA1388 family protein
MQMNGSGVNTQLDEMVEWLDNYLRIAELEDYPGAMNGLQLENDGQVAKIGAATDASLATIQAAAGAGCQMLLVHHGLFWRDVLPIVGQVYRRMRALFDANLAVYSAHLPLDFHPEVGNNVLLLKALGLELDGRFGQAGSVDGLGVWASPEIPRAELLGRIAQACGTTPHLIPGGPEQVGRVGIITGGGGSMIAQAAEARMDTLITGEGNHHTYHEAMELGLNVIYAGHYATETFGVKALASKIAQRFGVEWEFLDAPTGL